ncbi:molybdate ABC transporter permease subunit [Microaceticoccus formicicus]|uniref:molybdate ABC transporter permease subunit n=1 Tax=Microaceticoccus formicicus TaxID=3118105 RepID=UPI003CD05001|nr:molybdate ABC transporter permease subunit [Peptoniphilaceae bacterium AMB_02]
MEWSPFFISIRTALLATLLTFFLGIYAARYVMKTKKLKGIIDGIFTLPMVLPPTVVGFFLLIVFGNYGIFGAILKKLNIDIVFTWYATVISATIVSFPLMYRTALGAFEQVDPELIYAARTLGISERRIFWSIMVPVSRPGIIAGIILSFARALGEFGATIMIAGNIPGRTQTMSTAIYTAVQGGNRELAFKWALIIVGISLVMMVLLNTWSNFYVKSERFSGDGK